jgi:hypothetical protein
MAAHSLQRSLLLHLQHAALLLTVRYTGQQCVGRGLRTDYTITCTHAIETVPDQRQALTEDVINLGSDRLHRA